MYNPYIILLIICKLRLGPEWSKNQRSLRRHRTRYKQLITVLIPKQLPRIAAEPKRAPRDSRPLLVPDEEDEIIVVNLRELKNGGKLWQCQFCQ